MFKKLALVPIFFSFAFSALAACPAYTKIFGALDLQKQSWKTNRIDQDETTICGELPIPANPNLEITVQKQSKKFKTQIYRTLVEHWDHQDKDGNLMGGKRPASIIEVNTFVPSWFKGSRFIIKEISSNKVLTDVKL